jgi:hypothetical protein
MIAVEAIAGIVTAQARQAPVITIARVADTVTLSLNCQLTFSLI